MSDERIDFSSLDPSRDERRWLALADAAAERALSAHGLRATVSYKLVAWWRPALAAAAAGIALAAWIFAGHSGERREPGYARGADSAAEFAQWVLSGPASSAWEDVARAGGFEDDAR